MVNTKILVIGALFAIMAALFQVFPVIFSEVFVFLTIFSAIPIYIVARISPKAGVLAYLVAAMLIMIISTHEGLFFLCTNGIIGCSLGISSYYTNKKAIIWVCSSIALTMTLSIINYGIGIPVFGTKIPGVLYIQLVILFLFSVLYNIIYSYLGNFVYKRLMKYNVFRK
jgi:hypothetical protein